MFSKLAFIAPALLFAQDALAVLDKPLIQPPFPDGKMDAGLWTYLYPTMSTHELWGWGWLPDICKRRAERAGLSPYDIEVFNVRYTDCDEAWIMCRHHNSPMSQIDMIDIFGRMPVHTRDWVRHVIALPGGRSADASSAGDITLFGDAQYGPSLMIHEAGHCLDFNAVPSAPRFSSNATWTAAYDRDSAISDSYAASSQAENFAQETVISIFDIVVPGGVITIQPNRQALANQINAVKTALGDTIIPGGRCRRRWNHALNECMGPAAGCTSKMARNKVPDVGNLTSDDSVPKFDVDESNVITIG